MTDGKICAGVIGAGSIGISHMNSYQNSPQADLIAIADVDEARGREAGEKFGVTNVFTDYAEMLEMPDLEAVSICLPNVLHAPASIAGLRAGKDVLCEKPMTIDVASALEMEDTSRKTGKRLAMSLNLRHSGNAKMLKAAADSGELGEIYHGKGGMLRNNAIPEDGSTGRNFPAGAHFSILHPISSTLRGGSWEDPGPWPHAGRPTQNSAQGGWAWERGE